MRLSNYIMRTRALGEAKVPTHVLDSLGQMMAKGADLAALLKKRSSTLPARSILGVWRAAKRHSAHQALLDSVLAERTKDTPLTPALLKQTIAEHEVAVLKRIEARAPAGKAAEHRRRDAVKEALVLWNACLTLTQKEGVLKVAFADEESAQNEAFEDAICTGKMQVFTDEKWIRIQEGVTAGVLTLDIELPLDQFVAQVHKRGAELQAIASGLKADELLEAFVLQDVAEWAIRLKNDEVEQLGIREAADKYLALLTSPAVNKAIGAGVWPIGDAQIAVTVLTNDGTLLNSGIVDVGDNPIAAVESIMGHHAVEAVILPVQGSPTITAIASGFGEAVTIVRANSNGIDSVVAAMGDLDGDLGRALALSRRIFKPLKYWALTDPMTLNLTQYQLDEDALRSAMNDMRALALAGIKPEDLVKPSAQAKRSRSATKPLNPGVKTVDDLRPSMEVNGVVTNITQFGAFVNIGLSHEGLVHVSELADHFVNDPKEVVQIGQEVRARVLGVDRGRRRISLSLRPDRSPGARPDQVTTGGGVRLDDIPGRGSRRRSGFGGDRPRQAATGQNRDRALADLEALFKKE